ncbi:MAG: hypothetical protein K0R62_112 [Nonomuraea muscovyensis]|nr:hypothetical protein [Nonomuraea muscovyensis]
MDIADDPVVALKHAVAVAMARGRRRRPRRRPAHDLADGAALPA